jgi:hypothetical protein
MVLLLERIVNCGILAYPNIIVYLPMVLIHRKHSLGTGQMDSFLLGSGSNEVNMVKMIMGITILVMNSKLKSSPTPAPVGQWLRRSRAGAFCQKCAIIEKESRSPAVEPFR